MNNNHSRHTKTAVESIGRNVNSDLNVANNKIRRVRQRKKSDCGVACVAMVAGVPYRKAFDVFGFDARQNTFYTSHKKLEEALGKLGCAVQREMFTSWDTIFGSAILAVNRRCNRRNFHWIVFNGKVVLDPNPKRPSRQKSFARYRASGSYLLVTKSNCGVSAFGEGDRP